MEAISILSKLSMIQGSLTKKETKIVNYLKANINNLRTIKIEDLSTATGIGYSPIYSLIKKLGFQGYRDFVIAVVAEQERLNNSNLNADATENISQFYHDIIQRNNQVFDKPTLQKIVGWFKKAKIISIAGLGMAELAAQELSTRLFYFGFFTNVLSGTDENIILKAAALNENDVLICFCLDHHNSILINATKEAKARGAYVIAVTAKLNTDISRYADLNYGIITSALYDKSEVMISSLLPLIYWNDTLLQHIMALDSEKEYLDNKARMIRVVKKYR
ncbi:RpiR family transcriptional regulator [Spiroplasma syrphidicola EA-1]|uniref:RpiR family transcriptional regulator n=1 Tax=Spiroplasma syrphidicola EA-1 TaxID=1276229 RepID=R4UKQ1_9MOLU|nr:MurR/RpiR family transcriptional regulator [Spiroplasma syrphidicola]AGM25846.1 RpiR family transcriptional regulator [Spiroplasma syrphidicola EA-1]